MEGNSKVSTVKLVSTTPAIAKTDSIKNSASEMFLQAVPSNKNSYCILIPARNEQQSITEVIDSVHELCTFDVIVIDDASEDDTIRVAKRAGAHVIPLPVRLGAWGATQTGLRYALTRGYQVAVTMDADGQHEACYLPELLETLHKDNTDVAIGACLKRGSLPRRVAWVIMKKVSGLALEDVTSGFRAYNRPAMTLLTTKKASLLEFQDVGVLALLRAYGMNFSELQINMPKRKNGCSRIFNSWLAVAYYMSHTLILGFSKRGMSGSIKVRSAKQMSDLKKIHEAG